MPKQEARDLYIQLKAKQRQQRWLPEEYAAEEGAKVTVADLMKMVEMDYRRRNRKTMRDAEEKARFWVKLCGDRRAVTITGNDLMEWADEWSKQGLANNSINNRVSKLMKGYRLANRCHPPKLTYMPHWEQWEKAPARSNWMEVHTFMWVRSELPPWCRVPVTLAFYTGMRDGEVHELLLSQFNFYPEQRKVVFYLSSDQTKTKEQRMIVWGGEVFDILYAHVQKLREEKSLCPYVCQWKGKQVKSYVKAWKNTCVRLKLATAEWKPYQRKKKAGGNIGYYVKYTGPYVHDFRRGAVRNLIRAGVARDVAKKITGHKTDSVFERYNITSLTDLSQASEKYDAYMKELLATPLVSGQLFDVSTRQLLDGSQTTEGAQNDPGDRKCHDI